MSLFLVHACEINVTKQLCFVFHENPTCTLASFEPVSCVPEEDADVHCATLAARVQRLKIFCPLRDRRKLKVARLNPALQELNTRSRLTCSKGDTLFRTYVLWRF
jgi:hypothetical protein